MRRIILASAAAIGLSFAGVQAGSAADLSLPYKSPPPPEVFSWTGFYLGVNGGAANGITQTNANLGTVLGGLLPGTVLNLPLVSPSYSGFLGGGQIGYNWQTGPLVLGVEGEFDGADLTGNTACVFGLLNCNVKHDWVADIAARVGVVSFEKALVYVKGGAAWTDSKYSVGNSFTLAGTTLAVNGSASTTPVGGLLGMGIEYPFLPHWSAKIEYDYIDFGTQNLGIPLTASVAGVSVTTPAIPVSIKDTMQIVKAGVNYRF